MEIKKLVSVDLKIAVLYGGMSNEREVSLRSGKNVFDALKRLGYENIELIDVSKNIASDLINKKIDVCYLALHGKYGEDGSIQGLLEILGIPYTGCKVMASSISMDKAMTKKVLQGAGIPLIKSVVLNSMDDLENVKDLVYPVMIKPTTEGSSIGMVKVLSEDELEGAVFDAFKCSDRVLVEEFLTGISATIGVLENEGEVFATPVLELRTKTEWYDYEAKYTNGMTEFVLPAEISDELTKKAQDYAIATHKEVKARGVSRVDFLIVDNIPYVLEINTIPGMTDLSDLPAQSECMGISYDNLVQIILNSSAL